MCSQQTSTNSNPKTTTSYSPTTTNSKHDVTHNSSQVRDKTATINISDFAHKIKTITNTKMHEMHLDIVIITDVPIFTGAPIHSLENTEPKFGTGNARSSKEGHETSA